MIGAVAVSSARAAAVAGICIASIECWRHLFEMCLNRREARERERERCLLLKVVKIQCESRC
jgi:hypothetical protein